VPPGKGGESRQSSVAGTSMKDLHRPGSVQECRLRFLEWSLGQGIEPSLLRPEVIAWRVEGDFDPDVLARAILGTWRRHDALTATYHFGVFGDSPGQLLRHDAVPEVTLIDLAANPDAAATARALVQRHAVTRRPLEVAPQMSAQIIRASATDHVVSICFSSFMMDHWGYEVFLRDLAALYTGLAGITSSPLDDCLQYSEFADAEYEALRDGSWADSVDYWRDSYRGESPVPELRLAGHGGDPTTPYGSGGNVTGVFAPDTAGLLRQAWRDHAIRAVTPYSFMLAVLVVLLHRLTGKSDVGVLIPAANRDEWRRHDTVGLFATILAPRFREVPQLSFRLLCDLVRDTLASAITHQRVTYHDMLRRLEPERYGLPLGVPTCYFDFWIQEQRESAPRFGAAQAIPYPVDMRPWNQEGLALNIYDTRQSGQLSYSLSYARQLFDGAAAQTLVDDLGRLAVAAALEPESPVEWLAKHPTLRLPVKTT
jgi:hypothetical protein